MMEVEIRREWPEAYRAVDALTREAFWNQYGPGCVEHYLTHRLRECPAFLPELDFVAVSGGQIVGNIMAVKGVIECDSGERRTVVTIGPLSVLPPYQRKGIGGKLLLQVKREAKKMGCRALLLCGDPAYYQKQGFLPAEHFGIRTAEDEYAAALQAFVLEDGALWGAAGRYLEDEIYAVDEKQAEAFDRLFPEKEKRSGTPGQLRFGEVVKLRRKAEGF